MAREIIISSYNSDWCMQYEAEKRLLYEIYGNNILDIQHFGSTAVPGLFAKPVIDILVTARDINKIDGYNTVMRSHSYTPKGEYGIPERRYFEKTLPGNQDVHTHHVHIYQSGNPKINEELLFRDYLRECPSACNAYAELKMQLAEQYRFDPAAYSDGKSDLIAKILQQAIKNQTSF